ncbi:MAG: hypothetical protein AAF548_15415 [Actinomycetota bacterium]
MLIVHEVHAVDGRQEEEFDAIWRDEWIPAIGARADSRVLHFLRHVHGTGVSYRVVTMTAFADVEALDATRARIATGDLADLAHRMDDLRHSVTSKTVAPLPWSADAIDLATVPTADVDHRAALFMEDTVWPDRGRIAEYIERSGEHYARWMASDEHDETELLRIEAAYQSVYGGGVRNEIILWQRVTRLDWMPGLMIMEVPEHLKAPGTWMHDALQLRDQWESKLLRSTRWSPLA